MFAGLQKAKGGFPFDIIETANPADEIPNPAMYGYTRDSVPAFASSLNATEKYSRKMRAFQQPL